MLFCRCEGEDFILDGASDNRIGRLQRCDWSNSLRPLHLRNIEIGDADVTHFARLLQPREFRPTLFDVFIRFGPVDLVKIDHVRLEAAQAVLALAANRIGLERGADVSCGVPYPFALGEHIGTWGAPANCPGDYFFRVTQSVERGGVNPVEAVIQSGMDGGNRVAIILRPHAAVPATSAHGPGANSDGSNAEVAVSKLTCFHKNASFPGEKRRVEKNCESACRKAEKLEYLRRRKNRIQNRIRQCC